MELKYEVYGEDCFTHIFILGELFKGLYISRVLNKDIKITDDTIIEREIYIITKITKNTDVQVVNIVTG